MASLSDVLAIGTSGLQTAQTLVSVTSENISNVNTPGYARKVATQGEIVAGGSGVGAKILSVQRAANQFLQQAALLANAKSNQFSTVSSFMDQAQQLFGDPSSSSSFFGSLDSVYSAFSSAAATPSSNLSRSDALGAINTFLSNAGEVSDSLQNLQSQANGQITNDVGTINGILTQLATINGDISRVTVSGGDATGSQNAQSRLLNQLSSLIQVQVQPTPTGGVTVRSSDGMYLVGDLGASHVDYSTLGASGVLTATPPKGSAQQLTAGSGEIAGLMQLQQVEMPALSTQLGEFVSQAVSQLNAAHNEASSLPPPASLTGNNMGMALDTALSSFTGKTNIAITDANGVLQKTVNINFTGGGGGIMGTNGGGGGGFTASGFLAAVNASLGSDGTASYVNGVLTITASAGNGVVIADDPTTPTSNSTGQGFSQFFGMNDLIKSSTTTNYATSLTLASPNTFATGGVIKLEIADADGSAIRQATYTIPGSAAQVSDVINGLNASLGAYGSFSLDSRGELSFNPAANSGVSVSVISDNSANAIGSLTFSQTFGLGSTSRSARASTFSIRPDIAANPAKLAFAQLDLTQAIGGNAALAVGDGRGALALAQAGAQATQFSAAGGLAATKVSVSDYAAELSGMIGNKSAVADNTAKAASAVSVQANSQRASTEGVNMDQELVNLTTYQQSYNACSRLIQASTAMFSVLLQMI
jgi:flagellar hook-associated protein 1 FlgK